MRFFKFIDCFDAGYTAWQLPAPLESDAVKKIAAVGKWSFLGIYFLLEDMTIVSIFLPPSPRNIHILFLLIRSLQLDAMGIWVTPWAQETFIECHKWWFYGILLSIISSTVAIFFPGSETVPVAASNKSKQAGKPQVEKIDQTSEKQQKQEKPISRRPDLTPVVKNLIVDSLDILVPGSFLGWIPASPTQVGIAMTVSTLIASRDIWVKANL